MPPHRVQTLDGVFAEPVGPLSVPGRGAPLACQKLGQVAARGRYSSYLVMSAACRWALAAISSRKAVTLGSRGRRNTCLERS